LSDDVVVSKPHDRRQIRLSGYDYSQPGAYFVTICTSHRKNLFGVINNGNIIVNGGRKAVLKTWEGLPLRFPGLELDAFIVMPNHVHGIIIVGAQFIAPPEGVINHAPALGHIIRTFKASSAYLIRQKYNPHFAWQRNYYEHIVRDEDSLNRIREYIVTNPQRWHLDRENPHAQDNDEFDCWLSSFITRPAVESDKPWLGTR